MIPAIIAGAGKAFAMQKVISKLSDSGGGLSMASGVLQSYSDMKSAHSSNPLNMLSNPTKAVQGFMSNQLLKGIAGKSMTDGFSMDMFGKDDSKAASSSLDHYQKEIGSAVEGAEGLLDKGLDAAEKGAFGPKGIIVAKVAKAAKGFLSDMQDGKENLNNELQSQSFDVPLPNAIKSI